MGVITNSPLEQFLLEMRLRESYSNLIRTILYSDVFDHILIIFFFKLIVLSTNYFYEFYFNYFCIYYINLFILFVNGTIKLTRRNFIGYYLITFLVILNCNLMGMFPYSFALTSHFSITLFLSLKYKNIFFFSIFYPSGVPPLMLFLLIPIELISFSSRVLSLAIRLFANIMAGHILMKIFSKFCFVSFFFYLGKGLVVYLFLFIFIFLIIVLVFFLEVMVSFIQSYVFVTLKLIYLSEIL